MPSWECCDPECRIEMTAAVLKAWEERTISIRNITQEDFVNQDVVTLQCPKGHWCDYDRAGS